MQQMQSSKTQSTGGNDPSDRSSIPSNQDVGTSGISHTINLVLQQIANVTPQPMNLSPTSENSESDSNPSSVPLVSPSGVQLQALPRSESDGNSVPNSSISVSTTQSLASPVAASNSGSMSNAPTNTVHTSSNLSTTEVSATTGTVTQSDPESTSRPGENSASTVLQPHLPLCLVTMSKLDLMTYIGQYGLRPHSINEVLGISTVVPLPSNVLSSVFQVQKKIVDMKHLPVGELVSTTKQCVEGYLIPTQTNDLRVPHAIMIPLPNSNQKGSYSYSMFIPLADNSE